MPGPSNSRQKRRSNGNKPKKRLITRIPQTKATDNDLTANAPPNSLSISPNPIRELGGADTEHTVCFSAHSSYPGSHPVHPATRELIIEEPFIYDPGNGPRVRAARTFMSSFFAQPPSFDDPLCAEFAQEEVFQMLSTILPEETALILWYNKSRSSSRVCPACQRLYRLGDILQEHVDGTASSYGDPLPQLLREQELSGLCSPLCFILSSFNYPGAIKSAWGCTADDIDDDAWDLLNGPGEGIASGEVERALSMLVRMTRLHDLGLAQLCFDQDEAELLREAEYSLDALVLS